MGKLLGKCGEADEEVKKKEHVYIVTELIKTTRVRCYAIRCPVTAREEAAGNLRVRSKGGLNNVP